MQELHERKFEGIWIPKIIYLDKRVNWIGKILALEIHNFTSNGKKCFMSNEYIANFLQISSRQVSRYITQLKELGWIEETGFDGRKRYLRSCMSTCSRPVNSDPTRNSNQTRQNSLNSIDKNIPHIKLTKNQEYNFKKRNDFAGTNYKKRGDSLN